jgi:A/G-specific adenine glycosylase
MHVTAKKIVADFDGKFPDDFKSLCSLKGIGDYTTAAILSFAFNKCHAVVDGNVYRLLSRYFGIKTPIDSVKGKKVFQKIADELIEGHRPSLYNQAIMEFGARQCKPVDPDCSSCPLNQSCIAIKKNLIDKLPVKSGKTKVTKRYFNYLVIRQKNSFFLKKRTGKDIWNGLHDFPLIETKSSIKGKSLMQSAEWKNTFKKNSFELTGISQEVKHVLSHQHIHARFYELQAKRSDTHFPADWKKVTALTVKKYAIPRLIEKYLESSDEA